MVVAGFTFTVIVGAVPLKTVPSDSVPEMVPAPVTAKFNVAVLPLQIAVVPLNTAVGRGFTTNAETVEVTGGHGLIPLTTTV